MPAKKSVPASQVRKEGKPMAATENNYSKVIISDKEGNKYTLEFNARVIKNMERRGFQLSTDYPYTMIDDLFLGAFQMHHKGITPEKAKARRSSGYPICMSISVRSAAKTRFVTARRFWKITTCPSIRERFTASSAEAEPVNRRLQSASAGCFAR